MSGNTGRQLLHLRGLDRFVYFAPTLFIAYLATLCALLTLVALLFVTLPNPAALVGTGLFGLLVMLGFCALMFRAQRKELRYLSLPTTSDAAGNYQRVLETAEASGWLVAHKVPEALLEFRITGSFLTLGELLVTRFDGTEVLVAAISDPRIGYSMTGRERCRQHVELLRRALLAGEPSPISG